MIESDRAGRPEPGAFEVAEDGRHWTFRGALTLDDAARVLRDAAELPLPASGHIDFSQLHVADSAALAVLLALRRRASAEHRKLVFESLPDGVLALAHVYGVGELIGPAHR